jgi:hypothetical protein
VKVPARQTTVFAVRAFSSSAIQLLTVAEVAPELDAKVTVHVVGTLTGVPVGVIGLGMSPSPSASAWPSGSIGKSAAVTGGVGWATTFVVAPIAERAGSTCLTGQPRQIPRH